MLKNIKILSLLLIAGMLISGCISTPQVETDKNSQLTQGNIQLFLQSGQTTKAQVLENVGAPNVITRDSEGKEIWTYQRSAQISGSSSKNNFWTILLASQSGGSSGFRSSSRMMTLIIKFDENDIVSDFSSRTSNF